MHVALHPAPPPPFRVEGSGWKSAFALLNFVTALAGLTIQLCIVIATLTPAGVGFGGVMLKLTSYFTIVTNLLILGSHGLTLAAPRSRATRFICSPSFGSGLLLYISLVCSLYTLLLAPFWHPHGWQSLANVILHYATPVLYACFWYFFVPKARLPWKLSFVWLAYPVAYLVWVLGRGAILSDYPYYFMNPASLGYGRLLAYACGLGGVFLVGGCGVIACNRLLLRTRFREAAVQQG